MRILDRLGLRSRVQIAIFAYEHALVSGIRCSARTAAGRSTTA